MICGVEFFACLVHCFAPPLYLFILPCFSNGPPILSFFSIPYLSSSCLGPVGAESGAANCPSRNEDELLVIRKGVMGELPRRKRPIHDVGWQKVMGKTIIFYMIDDFCLTPDVAKGRLNGVLRMLGTTYVLPGGHNKK